MLQQSNRVEEDVEQRENDDLNSSMTSLESSVQGESDESEADDADDCVDLELTMWQVLRKSKAKNEHLKRLHSNISKAEIFEGDIMKFGES